MTSNLARRLEEVVPPEVGEGLLGLEILDSIKNLLMGGIGILLIPTFLKRNRSALQIIRKATLPPYDYID